MQVGLIYGGQGAEELSNLATIKSIETVLKRFGIKFLRVYLNRKISLPKILNNDLFFVVDSNSKDFNYREKIFKFIRNARKKIIGQTNSVFLRSQNKQACIRLFRRAGINVAASIVVPSEDVPSLKTRLTINRFVSKIGFPLIVKDNFGSSSQNLFYCQNALDLNDKLIHLSSRCREILIEEYIKGKEVTCPIVTLYGVETPLPPIELSYEGPIYDFILKNKTFQNKIYIPPRLPSTTINTIQRISLRACHVIGIKYRGRVDFRTKGNTLYILETNCEPVLGKNDFVARSAQKAGISYANLITGLLANDPKFVQYAKKKNSHLFQYINKNKITRKAKQ